MAPIVTAVPERASTGAAAGVRRLTRWRGGSGSDLAAGGEPAGEDRVPHGRHGNAQRRELLGRHGVDDVAADALDVDLRHAADRLQPAFGEHELDAAAVLQARLPPYPSPLLQPGGGVGEPAAGLHDEVG